MSCPLTGCSPTVDKQKTVIQIQIDGTEWRELTVGLSRLRRFCGGFLYCLISSCIFYMAGYLSIVWLDAWDSTQTSRLYVLGGIFEQVKSNDCDQLLHHKFPTSPPPFSVSQVTYSTSNSANYGRLIGNEDASIIALLTDPHLAHDLIKRQMNGNRPVHWYSRKKAA